MPQSKSNKLHQTGKGKRGRAPQSGSFCQRAGMIMYRNKFEAEKANPGKTAKRCGSGQHWHAR